MAKINKVFLGILNSSYYLCVMEYLERGRKFSISYKELRDEHLNMIELSDSDFLSQLPKAAHLAAIICWFKEIPSHNCLGDMGILHQLLHLIHIGQDDPLIDLQEIRKQFAEELRLC